MKKLLLSLSLVLNFAFISSVPVKEVLHRTTQVIESKNIKDVLRHATKGSLVLFDIDNTLAATKTLFGSDQWFSYMVKKNLDEGFDPIHSVNAVLPMYFLAQFNIDLELIDPQVLEVLGHLEEESINTACLTARSLHLAERTLEQIRRINIKMSPPSEVERNLNLAHPSWFKDGVLFSGLNDKGDILLAYLDSIGLKPEHILFVDDKHANIKTVELAALKREIPFTGIHYTALEESVKNYDHSKAEEEEKAFLASRR